MNKLVSLLGIAATLFFAGNSNAQLCVTWHNLTQAQRNQFILSAGIAQNGQSFTGSDGKPLQCKVWVQNVVYRASGGAVWLPQNSSDYTWYPSYRDVLGPDQCTPVQWCQPGQIIQMQIPIRGVYGPHTAIVWRVRSDGLELLDCNWNGDGRVQIHFVGYADFYRWTRSYYYRVYTVL